MKKATGIITYDVQVKCPHCEKRLALNQTPYNDDSSDFCLAEDLLGMALFGTTRKPAQWQDIRLQYVCCGCKQEFVLDSLEV